MTKSQLTAPLCFLQAIELPHRDDEPLLLERLASICNLAPPEEPKAFPSVAIPDVQEFERALTKMEEYGNWRFRINWPMAEGPTRIDAYSPEIDWRQLLDALSTHSVAPYEVASVFEALRRSVTSNVQPPRKLSGNILFGEASKRTLQAAQDRLGSKPYERVTDTRVRRGKRLAGPAGVLPPEEYLVNATNQKNYSASQQRIAQVASLVCKYALCSTYQISISQAIQLTTSPRMSSLAMACTATNTSKELLSVVAEIPVVMSDKNGSLVWYGQLHKSPTSEYRSHWKYHCEAYKQR